MITAVPASCLAEVPAADPEKVRQVQAGELREANTAWFGFNAEDSTAAIQGAIDSGAPRVIIPNVGTDWVVRPIKLRSNQEIVFEDGAVVAAKPGAFLGKMDSLFSAVDQKNLTLRGKGTLRMRKADYAAGAPYEKAEWRMALALYSCENVTIDGLTFAGSGGDGIYLGVNKVEGSLTYCKNVTIRNVVCDNNYRQGISVISAVDLLIEDSVFRNTGGTPPAAGIDFEPNGTGQALENIQVRRCISENNAGPGIIAYLRKLKESDPVSIVVEDCLVRGGDMGLVVGASTDGGSKGSIVFRNCTVENTNRAGAYVYDKAADGTAVRFENCIWRNVAISPGDASDNPAEANPAKRVPLPNVPVLIYLRRVEMTQHHGGVEFDRCKVIDDRPRPAVKVAERASDLGVSRISGTLAVGNPSLPSPADAIDLGDKRSDSDLRVEPLGNR